LVMAIAKFKGVEFWYLHVEWCERPRSKVRGGFAGAGRYGATIGLALPKMAIARQPIVLAANRDPRGVPHHTSSAGRRAHGFAFE